MEKITKVQSIFSINIDNVSVLDNNNKKIKIELLLKIN